MNEIQKYEGVEEEPEEGEEVEEMTFLEHLEDLRWVLFRCAVVFLIACGIVIFLAKDVSEIMKWPLERAYGSSEIAQKNLITIRPMGVFSVYIQISFLGGLGLSLPFLFYFISSFIMPGLSLREKAVLLPGCIISTLLFLAGAAMTYFFILPLSLAFSVMLNNKMGLDLMWAASEYYSLVVWLTIGVGLSFQFPLILILLAYIGLVPTPVLKKGRRTVLVVLMVFCALITPGGDPVSLALMTVPMYLLYEAAIFFAAKIEKKKAEEEKANAEEES